MTDWRDMPSLAALRAFEAAARRRSLSAAAAELNVTHAAVSHHVRALEADLGAALLRREGRGMAPTDEGAGLAAALGEGFETIREAVARLRDAEADRPLQLSVTPAFATNWLVPRIGDFWARHPEIDLNILPARQLVDLRRDGVDVAIRFGTGPWPPYAAEVLTDEAFWVVAHPRLVAGWRVEGVGDLMGEDWMMDRALRERTALLAAEGVEEGALRMRLFNSSAMVMSAVREGLGVTLQPCSLVAREVAEGGLVRLLSLESPGLGYHVVTDPRRPSPRTRTLVRWLRRQAPAGSCGGDAKKGP
ncbi:LysR family transcriptional regulator [Jannaschia sp. W003]|uniref:LysR family transcriptional regulator n=1 Tax=Jannaschia sp. W003 TaxID=2867012 RepID=UPI0021A7348B|nr:LysR family transcriptional regulator [Jannaschia sp. W003]UWQ22291.1 LysR family transcriptional regulator [Jannaschia sp. W003]